MGHPIQIVLMRQLAAYLSVPVFLVDPAGSLLFYNDAAEAILGLRFQETGVMPAEEWSASFTPVEEDGTPVPPEALPLRITLSDRRPAHKRFLIRGRDGVRRHIEVASIPLTGLTGEFLGAAALFWQVDL